ncbi:hypothetical protein OBBRIDRAFT_799498 [Obba rivulosa]|uniref:Uncharacterized protein n=1 Tax=Obba rivulosa TaxID=1052685 RepID=A0A8E2AL29_9APHY|nr:hypothetical protein OBBRIDRAFT_799498 [Obba rivulosa]
MSLPPSTTASSPLPEAFPLREPAYSPGSPFAAIAALRPPHVPRRTALHSASAHEVLILAMDQFARGIFRMPHVQLRLHSHSYTTSHPYSLYQPFSRAAQLFSIATSILGVAERLRLATQRAHWAQQADGVLAQMRMEGLEAGVRVHAHAFPHTHPHTHAAHSHSPTHSLDGAWAEEDWRGAVAGARGRCWLVVGTARGESSETALEGGADPAVVLNAPDAADAREALGTAITFFERAKGGAASSVEETEISPLIAEALLTLANLTADENTREELYARAQAEAGEGLPLGLELPVPGLAALALGVTRESKPQEDEVMDVRMDERMDES